MADQLRTAFGTGAGPAKRIHSFALQPDTLAAIGAEKDQATECAVERTMVPSSIMENSISVQSLDELALFLSLRNPH